VTPLHSYNIVIDTLSEVYTSLKHLASTEFWDFSQHDPIKGSIYIVGRRQVSENLDKFRAMARSPDYIMIFNNSAEGSSPLVSQLRLLDLHDLVLENRILLISGGELDHRYPYMLHEYFLEKILDYDENIVAIQHSDKIYTTSNKPWDFLFLNGRGRPHRKYLWERFNSLGLLNRSLWTMLDSRPTASRHFKLSQSGVNLMTTSTPIQCLPTEYEVDQFRDNKILPNSDQPFIKHDLFNNLWGEIYLVPEVYQDTYFSVVTETVFDYPYSFRTEKIAKPLLMAHPWICATSPGFYRDMHKLGFKTFGNLIDESFDSIDNHQDRMDRIIDIVKDLCETGPASFLVAAHDVCKYNQQHLINLAPTIRAEFPDRFFNFVNKFS
jgi:hypothetical protein